MNIPIMTTVLTITATFLLGCVGYYIFNAIHMPAPGLTGALVINAIVTSLGAPWSKLPIGIILVLQIMIGIMIGSQFNKEKFKQIKKLAIPGLVVGLWMILTGLILGFAIAKLTNIDIGTALFSAVPGGLTEMSVLAMAYHLDVPKVVLFQFLRVVGVYLTVPLMASHYCKGNMKSKKEAVVTKEECSLEIKKEMNIFYTVILGGLSGYIAWILKIPAGAIIGPMLIIGGLRTYGCQLKALPRKSIISAQIGLGAFLGLTFTKEVAGTMIRMLPVSLFFTFLILANGFFLGVFLHKVFKWELTTALLACAAAGVSQMSAIALEMDADAIIVSVIQTIRLVMIILILPPLILLIIN